MTKIAKARSHNYLRQIKGTVIYKAVAVVASYIAVPMMIHYLGQEMFGIWSTLLSIISWIVFFDLGIGHGLRNKITESLAKNAREEAARYVSSGYSLIGLLALGLWITLIAASFFIPWQNVFNTNVLLENDLRLTLQLTASFILFNFWTGLITALLNAVQKSSLLALRQLISNVLVLALIWILSRTTTASLPLLAIAYGVSLVLANLLLSGWFFRTYNDLKPRFSIEKKYIHVLLGMGSQFLMIQIAMLVIFTTDKLLITQLIGPAYVTTYDVVFKLFGILTFLHNLICFPLWSAYADAYHRGDMTWIKRMFKKQMWFFVALWFFAGAMVLLARPIIALWIGPDIIVTDSLVLLMGISVLIIAWLNIYTMFVNGIGAIRPQLYVMLVGMVINIPLSVFFARYMGMGVSGIVMGTIFSLLPGAIVLPIQVYRILRRAEKVG
jgi:O-antigen/teichoic acid export membrane protein